MNKQDLLAKIAAMKAPGAIPQDQATTPAKIAPQAPTAAPQEQEPTPAAETLQSFYIDGHEGTGSQDDKTFTTWAAARAALQTIYNEGTHAGGGYYKTFIKILFNGGFIIKARLDIGDHPNYNPHFQTVGEYISHRYPAHLNWNEDSTPGSTDEDSAAPELSTVTFADLMNSNHPEGAKLDQILAMGDQPAPTATAPANVATNSPAAPAGEAGAAEITLDSYSPKSFAVRGAGTIAIKDKLLANGGTWNRYLKGGAGWIFSNKRLAAIQQIIK